MCFAGECYFLLHSENLMTISKMEMFKNTPNIYPFSNDICAILDYPPQKAATWRMDDPHKKLNKFSMPRSFFPLNVHFPVLYFFLNNQGYDYYWLVEYDVRFSGSWKYFFNSFQDVDADLITSRMWKYSDNPSWCWWKCIWHPRHFIPLEERLSSFNPVYRISNRALQHLHNSHGDGWVGHYEVVVPTLLQNSGFKLVGIGGAERFVPPDQKDKFYTPKTFRWRPVFKAVTGKVNKLYHPVKV